MNSSPKLAISNRLRSTPFTHRLMQQGVKAFTVYNHMLLPTEFDSMESDYWHLCEHVQVWDVGAERQVAIQGVDAQKLVQWMTPRDISKVDVGRCVYLPLADEQGYLINDPVGLRIAGDQWWLSIADSDVLLWAKGLAAAGKLDVAVSEPDVWPLAVQGPKADELMARVFGDIVLDIGFFRFQLLSFEGHEFRVARSGWSKQGGYEVYVDNAELGVALYDALFSAGESLKVRPGCPNLIERMEGSLLSYGNDMTMNHTVLESGLDSFFDLNVKTESLAGDALRAEQLQGPQRKLFGLVIPSTNGAKPVATEQQHGAILDAQNRRIGRLGSQVWSPRYRHQLATVMLENPFMTKHVPSQQIEVKLADGSLTNAKLLSLPFDFKAAGIDGLTSKADN